MAFTLLPCLFFVWLPIATAYYVYTPCDNCTDRATTSELNNISFVYFPNNTSGVYKSVLVEDAASLVSSINLTKPTIFYLFGWTESLTSTSVQTVTGAYFTRGDHNVIVIDWSNIATQEYAFAFLSVGGVGWMAAQGLGSMVAAGMNSTLLHIVGHSLGAQIAGYMGRSSNFTLPRITVLDAAGPGFYILEECVHKDDAKFVDAIHTDLGLYGTASDNFTVNFYPNGGTRYQPGCTVALLLSDEDFCSHHRSWYYYAESLLAPSAFDATKCSSIIQWYTGLCDVAETAIMGYGASNNLSGNYYLQTNSASPYGRGTKGSTFNATVYLATL